MLESVENSLRNPVESSALLHTCEFFSDVMLHDFPAEVFLQRPVILIVSTYYDEYYRKLYSIDILGVTKADSDLYIVPD